MIPYFPLFPADKKLVTIFPLRYSVILIKGMFQQQSAVSRFVRYGLQYLAIVLEIFGKKYS
jgi:hypothetical protein